MKPPSALRRRKREAPEGRERALLIHSTLVDFHVTNMSPYPGSFAYVTVYPSSFPFSHHEQPLLNHPFLDII
jgi:hypothetical protein